MPFLAIAQGVLIVSRAAAAPLNHERGQVVGGIGEGMRGLGGHGGRTSDDRHADLGQRDPDACPEGYQYGPRAVIRHDATSPPDGDRLFALQHAAGRAFLVGGARTASPVSCAWDDARPAGR